MSVVLDSSIHTFAAGEFAEPKDLLRSLGKGNDPVAVMITCADLGSAPFEVSHANVGEIYTIQNLGNIIPDAAAEVSDSTLASLELGLQNPRVRHLIVCGHEHCRFTNLLSRRHIAPAHLTRERIQPVWSVIHRHYTNTPREQILQVAAQENVLLQLERLRLHECVRSRLLRGNLNLHGWLLDDHTARIRRYCPADGQFVLT